MTNYHAKRSNLKELLAKNNLDIKDLERITNISQVQLNEFMVKKVMNLNTAMTISKQLNCQIEDLYVWNVKE